MCITIKEKVAVDTSQYRPTAGVCVRQRADFVVGKRKGKNTSGMHGVKKVKLSNIKRNSFKERN